MFLELREDSTLEDETMTKKTFFVDPNERQPVFKSLSGRTIYKTSKDDVYHFKNEYGVNELSVYHTKSGLPIGRHRWYHNFGDNSSSVIALTRCSKVINLFFIFYAII